MSSPPPSQAMYLDGAPDPVCAIFHPASVDGARDTSVLLCPPFGWDEVCSYRSRRTWAARLAQAGYPTLRLSFPATGDSGGSPRDPDRLEAWTASVQCGVRWLREATGARRAAAVGVELGGLVAYRAAATGAPIDDLILWATPSRGRALVRQLRAFSKLEAARFFESLEPPPPLPPGEMEAGGFLLSAHTVQALEDLDLTALALPAASSTRVLLLERDGLAVDARLKEHLELEGVDVTVALGDGYAAMTSHPQRGRPPFEVIERVAGWLDEASTVTGAAGGVPAKFPADASLSARIPLGGGLSVREKHVAIQQPFGELAGVLVEPLGARTSDVCVVLLTPGAIRRIGPDRMWVEAARRWAARGVPTLRLDVEGTGDADGAGDETAYIPDSNFYLLDRVPQVLAALDFLEQRAVANTFVVGGMCAGAYWSFHTALRDPRVSTAWLINPSRVVWDAGSPAARDLRMLFSQRPSLSKISTAFAEGRVRRLALWMLGSPKRAFARMRAKAPTSAGETDALLAAFQASGKRMMLLFAEGQPFDDELRRSGWMSRLTKEPTVMVEHIAVRDHTLRPTWAQGRAHEVLDRALDGELAARTSPDLKGVLSR